MDINDRNVDQSFGRRINALTWGVSHFEKWHFSNLNISFRIFIVGIANFFLVNKCKKIDEQVIEYSIVVDRSGAEKYEFIHESCVFSLLLFQPNNINMHR